MAERGSFSTLLATFFGVGWIAFAPGTFASAAALPFGWVMVLYGWKVVAAGACAVTVIGVWACGRHARKVRLYDPSECVLDEVAGQWFALIPVALADRAHDWRPYLMAFLLFRLFDIWKPWPVAPLERLPGGLGIMMDDVAAGLIAAGVLYGMLWIRLI
jgi:phosphatidylglycerophosphatase A